MIIKQFSLKKILKIGKCCQKFCLNMLKLHTFWARKFHYIWWNQEMSLSKKGGLTIEFVWRSGHMLPLVLHWDLDILVAAEQFVSQYIGAVMPVQQLHPYTHTCSVLLGDGYVERILTQGMGNAGRNKRILKILAMNDKWNHIIWCYLQTGCNITTFLWNYGWKGSGNPAATMPTRFREETLVLVSHEAGFPTHAAPRTLDTPDDCRMLYIEQRRQPAGCVECACAAP